MAGALARPALAALLLFGCSAPAPATDLVPSPLQGAVWRVVAIDGRPVETGPGDDGRPRLVAFTFGARSYGGSAGCNALGGLYAQIENRLYTMPGPQTAMACGGAVGAQEDAANAIFNASPMVERRGEAVILSGGGHRMEVVRLRDASRVDPPGPWQGHGVAGQSYVIHQVNGRHTDGKRIWSRNPPRLTFAGERVEMTLDCPAPAQGRFTDGLAHMTVAGLAPSCLTPGTRDAELTAILAEGPRTVAGPNGELLLASHAGWAILWNDRRDRPK